MDLLASITELRVELHGLHAGARTDDAARRAIADFLKPGLATEGHHLTIWPAQGPLRMAVLAWPVEQAWHGSPAFVVTVAHRPGDREAAQHACAALDTLGPQPHFDLHLDAHLVEVRAHLLSRGLGIDSVTQIGSPAVALAGLSAPDPLPAGLQIRPLTVERVPDVITLHRDFFTAHPEFCWFGAHPAWLKGFSERLVVELHDPHEVVMRGDQVLGYWGSDLELDHPLWGRKSGIGVILHPEVQGRGLIKHAYHRLLTAQVAAGIEVFKGGTSQPAVMGLGRKMGRRPETVWIRPREKTFFDASYFDVMLISGDTPATPIEARSPGRG